MRQLSLACLLFVAALAMSGCANRNLCGGGGCGGGACGGGLRDGLGPCMGRCASGSQRMFGQSAESAVGSGMYARGGGHGGHGGYLASGWRGGCHNDEYRKDQPPYGPQSAQVAYPYYTTRGPRDFLVDNPPSIGP